jgi:hypothetical protein
MGISLKKLLDYSVVIMAVRLQNSKNPSLDYKTVRPLVRLQDCKNPGINHTSITISIKNLLDYMFVRNRRTAVYFQMSGVWTTIQRGEPGG